MFRWKYLVPAFVVVALLAAIPTAYSARWHYCKKYGDYSENYWVEIDLGFPPPKTPAWFEREAGDLEVADRWVEMIRPHYAETEDSWHGLSEDEQRSQEDRFWSNRPENIYRGELWMTINPVIAGTTYHNINFVFDCPTLIGGAISSDEQWQVDFFRSEDRLTSLYFRKVNAAGAESEKQWFSLFGLIFEWSQEYEFEGITYRVWASLADRYDFDWTSQKKFFVSESEFKRLALEVMDEMESEIVQFVDSKRPPEGSYKIHVKVDVVKCTCQTIREKPNRPLTPAEKEQILQEARTEINRRRELIQTHGQVWFETLEKILIPLE